MISSSVFAVGHRCCTIPVISKRMLQIHRQCPPARKHWIIANRFKEGKDIPGPLITRPMLEWLKRLSGTLEMLTVDRNKPTDAGMLPQLLMVAAAATKLYSLAMSGSTIDSADLCSLGFLRQLRQLWFENCHVPGAGHHMHDIHCLSGLRSLQVCPHTVINTHTHALSAQLTWEE